MSQKKVGQVSASAVFFGAILLFSMSAHVRSTSNALQPAMQHNPTITAEGTVPPPVAKPIKPTSLS
jgi:hypothetical protein